MSKLSEKRVQLRLRLRRLIKLGASSLGTASEVVIPAS